MYVIPHGTRYISSYLSSTSVIFHFFLASKISNTGVVIQKDRADAEP